MSKSKKSIIEVQGTAITVLTAKDEDFISLSDMLKAKDGDFFIADWLRNRNTVEFLGIWESIHNPSFNYGEFATIKSQAGLNSYKISVKDWVAKTNAIGLRASAGRYGGTSAHKDIAFEFGMWISPEFKIYLIKEFQRLKQDENRRLSLAWNLNRTLSKLNYRSPNEAKESWVSWVRATLGQFSGERGQSVELAKTPEKRFKLYSVPSFPDKKPEVVSGKEVGSNKQLVEPHSVLICKINPRINRAWVVGNFTPHTKIASTEWIVFPPTDEIAPEFLCYFLQQNSVRDFLAHNASGVGGSLMRVKPSTLRDFPFASPKAKEQRRIVAEIEKQFTRLEAGATALRRVQANLKRYRAAVLKAACEGKLVPTEAELTTKNAKSTKTKPDSLSAVKNPGFESGEALLARILTERRQNWQGRGKYKEPAAPDTVNLPSLPEGWTWARLEQLGLTFGGLTKNPKRAKLAKQLPYLRVANVYANKLRLDEIEHIGVEDSELAKLLVRTGNLLIVEGNGSKDQIGRLAIGDGSIDPCVHQNQIIKVRPVEARMPKALSISDKFSVPSEFRKRAATKPQH